MVARDGDKREGGSGWNCGTFSSINSGVCLKVDLFLRGAPGEALIILTTGIWDAIFSPTTGLSESSL